MVILRLGKNRYLQTVAQSIRRRCFIHIQHPDEESSLNEQSINIGTLNNTGQAAFGDNASFTDNHSTNIDNSVHQLLSVENQLSDEADKELLHQLAATLESALKSAENPKPKFLSKFKNFIDKTWKITGPVITPLLVELGKRIFF